MVKSELAVRVRSVSSWVGKPVFMCWCFVLNAKLFIQIIATIFLRVKLPSYCVLADLLEVRPIYAFLFKDVIVEPEWYTPISYSNVSKINIKMSLMRMSAMDLAKCWVTTSCLVIWTQKGGETPTKMAANKSTQAAFTEALLLFITIKEHLNFSQDGFPSFLISTLETHAF